MVAKQKNVNVNVNRNTQETEPSIYRYRTVLIPAPFLMKSYFEDENKSTLSKVQYVQTQKECLG